MKSSVLNSATSSCEQVNNSVDSVNPEVQIEINNNEEASTSTASAPNVSVSDVSGIVNAAEASQVPEVATISSVRKRCDQNVNKDAVEDAVSTITPDSVTPSSSSNALNEQLPSGNDTGDVKHRYKTQNPSQSRSKRTAVIMGDSLVKNINGWELKEKCGNQGMNIFVKNFNGATTRDMHSYAQPSIERKPNLILLHSGTNDLSLKIDGKEKTEVQIAEEIIDLAKSISDKGIEVVISGLITRGDRYESKRKRVNFVLQDLCSQNDFAFLEHNNIHANQHLNRSLIHLNRHGDNILSNNLLRALNF